MTEFIAGQALANKSMLEAALRRLENKNVLIENFVYEAVEEGKINTRHPDVYLKNKEMVVWNNRKMRFSDLQKHMNNSDNPNYEGTREFPEIYKELVEKYLKLKCFRVCKKEEEHLVQINPMNVIQTREDKFSLIIHSIDNCKYKKPACTLLNVLERGNQFMETDYLMCEDLKSCYHQYALNAESMYSMGVKYGDQILIAQVCFYGPSPAVKIINTLVNLVVLDSSLRHDVWAESMIDDIIVFGNCPQIFEDIKAFGLIFSPSKGQRGSEIQYCGFRINVKKKEIEVLEKTYKKIQKIAKKDILKNDDLENYIHFEKLEELCGILAHCSRTSPTGLSRAYFLIKKLSDQLQNPESMVKLDKEEMREINWWSQKQQIMPIKFLPTTGCTIQIFDSNPYPQKKQKIDDCSDASGSYFCAKINGVAYCNKFPPEIENEHITLKELYAGKFGVFKAEDNQSMNMSLDNTNAVNMFNKKRSTNEKCNKMIEEIYEEMHRGGKIVTMRWICTADMASEPGADRLSRRDYRETYDSNTLSKKGVQTVLNTFGPIAVDCFSSPTNNCFEGLYCSAFYIMDDPNNLQECGLSFLTSRKLRGNIWIYAPDDLVIPVARIVANLKWKEMKYKAKLLILVRAKRVRDVWSNLWRIRNQVDITRACFQKANQKSGNIEIRLKDSLILFAVGNYGDRK